MSRVEKVLQEDRRGERVNIFFPATGSPTLFPNQRQGACRAHPFIPELDREPASTAYQAGKLSSSSRALFLFAVGSERQTDHSAHGLMLVDELEKSRHGKTFPRPARERLERGSEGLRLVRQREADANLSPVDGEQTAG